MDEKEVKDTTATDSGSAKPTPPKKEEDKDKKKNIIIILLLLLLVVALFFGFFGNKGTTDTDDTLKVDDTQSTYVKPEEPVDRSKTVSLPGWSSFTIPANTKNIDVGFEYHNPEENYWYEDTVSYKGKTEKLVVDSGTQVDLSHYLKLGSNNSKVTDVKKYNKKVFNITKNDAGNHTVEAVGSFKGTEKIVVETEDGKEATIEVTCNSNCYYMTFGLFLKENDECLYQSGLVAPGKYIQKMKMNKALKPGTYKAYVVCQPYKSDKKSKTNSGVVNLDLIVK